jgi:tetratricopeptide (TPR) repeat protein
MKQIFNFSIMTIMALNCATAQSLDINKMKAYEHQLDDVMELMDTNVVKSKLQEVENAFQIQQTELNKVRLGIIYHETALNLSFLSKTTFKGYAQKSYDILNELFTANSTTAELMPFVASYRASALSLVGAETKKLNLLSVAFKAFDNAVTQYAAISYCPEFLRGSVAENLPWFFFKKRRFAKQDFESIIEKQHQNPAYANWKIMSFSYWAWANKHRSQKVKAMDYLDKAITLDPNYQAGRKRAEDLKMGKLSNQSLASKN